MDLSVANPFSFLKFVCDKMRFIVFYDRISLQYMYHSVEQMYGKIALAKKKGVWCCFYMTAPQEMA